MEPFDPLNYKSLRTSTHVACACRSAIALRKLRTLQRGVVWELKSMSGSAASQGAGHNVM
jgi:hypothetical protein